MAEVSTPFIDFLGLSAAGRHSYCRSLGIDVSNNLDDHFYSPDGSLLNKYLEHDVFVFDRLKAGFSRHHLLFKDVAKEKVRCLGFGVTASNVLKLYHQEGVNGQVVMLTSKGEEGAGRVCGEVWRVPTKVMFDLDFYMSNHSYNKRTKMIVRIKRNNQYIYQPCWGYMGMVSYWKDLSKQKKPLKICDQSFFSKDENEDTPHYLYTAKLESEKKVNILH